MSIEQWPAGKLLQHAREHQGLSKAEASRRSGLSESWWRRLETGINIRNGKEIPTVASPETLARAAQAVGLPVSQILTAAGHAPEDPDTEILRTELVDIFSRLQPHLQREALAYVRGLSVGSR